MTKNDPVKPAILASRGSQLALWQAQFVATQIENFDQPISIKVFKTKGDLVTNRFLHEIGGKGVFIRELEKSLLSGESDLAVHSLKDLPAEISAQFTLSAILTRHSPKDSIIFHPDFVAGKTLPKTSFSAQELLSLGSMRVATSSLRRTCLLRNLSKNFQLAPVRGNVDTRINKLHSGNWDALILATASLERLHFPGLITRTLDPEWFTPSPAQGALAVETLINHHLNSVTAKLNCPKSEFCVTLERRVLALLGGDCTMPFGCWAYFKDEQLYLKATVLDYQGKKCESQLHFPATTDFHQLEIFAQDCFHSLCDNGVKDFLTRIRQAHPELGTL